MKYINISVHDLTKSNIKMVEGLVKMLREEGVDKISFLIIPEYHNIESIDKICEEVKHLVSENEVILHGYSHLGKRFSPFSYKNLFTNDEGEFVSFEDTQERLIKGLDILSRCGFKPDGFIPPAWLMKKEEYVVLRKLGFKFTTDRRYLYDLQSNRKYFSPVLTFSSRKILEWLSVVYVSSAWKFVNKLSLVRIALHPKDIKSKTKISLLKNILGKIHSRKIISLTDYIDEINLTKNK
ncbi:MAG: polysaccharide deacetylase family protein [Hydrogenothermaceae bacterium]